jgi:hypothetical protein
MAQPEPEIVRWYTHGRKFPKLIGKTTDGRAIWGGPYTHTQAIAAGLLLYVAGRYPGLWAHFGVLNNLALLAGTVFAVVRLIGKLPLDARNPLMAAHGTYRAVNTPALGKISGRAVRLPKPHRVRARVRLDPMDYAYILAQPAGDPAASGVSPAASPPAAAHPAPAEPDPLAARTPTASARVAAPVTSNVQRLLAAAGKESS